MDAPELGQPFGDEAKQILAEIVQDCKLSIQVYYKDIYDREVGDAYVCDTGIFVQVQYIAALLLMFMYVSYRFQTSAEIFTKKNLELRKYSTKNAGPIC